MVATKDVYCIRWLSIFAEVYSTDLSDTHKEDGRLGE